MKNLISLCLLLAAVMAGCGEKSAPDQKTYLYCRVDTLWQSLPSYQVTSNTLFPYGKLAPADKMSDADYRDGVAVIELAINRPTTISVMPVRDSTVQIAWGGHFLLLPGDSLELLSEPDTASVPGYKCVRPRLAEISRKDNACEELRDKAFPYKDQPKAADGDLVRYKSELTAYYQRKRAFLDSCRVQMPLSQEYLDRCEALSAINFYNDLCRAVEANPDSKAPAGYLGNAEISQTVAGSAAYVTALVNKYIKQAVAEPESHFDEVYAGIGKAPRRQRDYLTALMIGYFAGQEQPAYKEQLERVIAQSERSIGDTVYLNYIARAGKFYEKCGTALPDEVTETGLRLYGEQAQQTLADVLARFEGQAVYLDFWSSWCCGCIMDIMQSAEAKQYFSDAGIAYVYLSLDEDAQAWSKAVLQYDVTKYSFIVSEAFKSPVCKYFEISSIPRYILLDKQHRIVSSDAPRPVKHELKELKRLTAAIK